MPGGSPAAKTTAGKESICLDLKHAQGRAIAQQLVRKADILVHNYRPGVAERLGLGEDELRQMNPGLIWVAVTGYGRHSPGARRPSTHPCAGAASGGASYQAGSALSARWESYAELCEISRRLVRANESNPDPNTSVVAASAILLALLHRERTGEGQGVYVNMLTANLYANAEDALAYDGKPPRRQPDDQLYGLSATYRLYRSADGWVFVGVGSDDEWVRLCRAVGRSDLTTDARFRSAAARLDNNDVLADALAALLATRRSSEWEDIGLTAKVGLVSADATTAGAFFSD